MSWEPQTMSQEIRDALKHPGVAITVAIVGGIVVLAAVGAVGALAYFQRDATGLLSLANLIINAVLFKRVSDVDGRMRVVESQTNGNTSRLMDAVGVPKKPEA